MEWEGGKTIGMGGRCKINWEGKKVQDETGREEGARLSGRGRRCKTKWDG
jgi:hypothetical protein